MLQKKTTNDEVQPPAFAWTIRDYNDSNHVRVVFNKTKHHFEYDIVAITIGKTTAHISRDDLAAILITGYKATQEYIEKPDPSIREIIGRELFG